jgi:hypothetical protein
MEQEIVLMQERQPYTPPGLEQHGGYVQLTGGSAPFRNVWNFDDFFEFTEEVGE